MSKYPEEGTLAYLVQWRNDLVGPDSVVYDRPLYELLQERIGALLDKMQEEGTPVNIYPVGDVVASFMNGVDLEEGIVLVGVDKYGHRFVASSMHVSRVLKALDDTTQFILKDAKSE